MPHYRSYQEEQYQIKDEFEGECPRCGDWEAPITAEELASAHLSKRIHRGSSTKDPSSFAGYPRIEWYEFFRCPKCGCRFCLQYSDV